MGNGNENGNGTGRRGGFTILEMLVVVAVIAIIATLATGAALKAIRHGRQKRVETMRMALEVALAAYRVQNGEWPFNTKKASTNRADVTGWEKDKNNNVQAFGKLYETADASHRYLDCSSFFTIYKRKRMRLGEVPEGQRKGCPIGYPDPRDLSFRVFGIIYNEDLDTVEVYCPPRSDKEYERWKEGRDEEQDESEERRDERDD